MSPVLVTTAVIVAVCLFLVVYDIFAAWKWGEKATISYVMGHYGRIYPIIVAGPCLIVGVLIGHFWWPIVTIAKEMCQ